MNHEQILNFISGIYEHLILYYSKTLSNLTLCFQVLFLVLILKYENAQIGITWVAYFSLLSALILMVQ